MSRHILLCAYAAVLTINIAEWQRPDGPRGPGDKADVDIEIESQLRPELLSLFDCDFWGEETGFKVSIR